MKADLASDTSNTVGPVPPVLLIHGEERYLIDAGARRWKAMVSQGGADVEIIESPAKLDALQRSLQDMPLFDPCRYVLVRDAPQLSGPSRRGAAGADALARALEERSPATFVCLVQRGKVAATNPVLATIGRLGGRVVYHPAQRGRELREWLEAAGRERGLRLPAPAIDHILRTVGNDIGMLSGELDKLVAYKSGAPLTLKLVRQLVSGDDTVEVWSVIERLLGTRPGEGVVAVQRLVAGGRSSQYLLTTLGGQFREILHAQALMAVGKGGSAEVARTLGMPGWRADRLVRQARQVPGPLVMSWLHAIQQIDSTIKAGEADDIESLQAFGLRVATELTQARNTKEPAA